MGTSIIESSNNLRVAWLLPVAWFYWQPVLSEFTRLFPKTTVFTGLFPGFAKGCEDSLTVELVGKTTVVGLTKSEVSYGDNFTYLSPAIVGRLLATKPHIIFTSSFGIWTLLAILLKPLGRWRIVIAYEGSSPGVDYCNSWLRLTLRRAMVRVADACITNSDGGKAYLTHFLHAKEKNVFVKPYEIPVPEAFSVDLKMAEQKNRSLKHPIFLFAGHIVPRKGLNFLLDACAILQAQGCSDYTLLVVGNGEQQEALESFSQEHNLTECICWEGRVDYDLIGSYFNCADVFVLPTLEDTWGVVVLEAMLFGKPVLCSKGAGSSELVKDGENGYVFDPCQPEKLAALMRQFIDNPQLVVQMGERSKQIISQYTPSTALKTLAEVTQFALAE